MVCFTDAKDEVGMCNQRIDDRIDLVKKKTLQSNHIPRKSVYFRNRIEIGNTRLLCLVGMQQYRTKNNRQIRRSHLFKTHKTQNYWCVHSLFFLLLDFHEQMHAHR